jgi:hypothetical protein
MVMVTAIALFWSNKPNPAIIRVAVCDSKSDKRSTAIYLLSASINTVHSTGTEHRHGSAK